MSISLSSPQKLFDYDCVTLYPPWMGMRTYLLFKAFDSNDIFYCFAKILRHLKTYKMAMLKANFSIRRRNKFLKVKWIKNIFPKVELELVLFSYSFFIRRIWVLSRYKSYWKSALRGKYFSSQEEEILLRKQTFPPWSYGKNLIYFSQFIFYKFFTETLIYHAI